jgi:hypothetical protein
MHHRIPALITLCVSLIILILPSYASENLKTGSGSFIFNEECGNKNKPLTVWYYYPQGSTINSPILFAIHGSGRKGKGMRNVWIDDANKLKLIVLAPEFTKESYPYYNRGSFRGPMSAEPSSFTVVEGIFDYVKSMTGNVSQQYYIYGHSAGGQFVHRLVILYPQARVKLAIAANAGWYTMPDFSAKFPYGLKGSGIGEDNLKESFHKKLIVLLGENDTDENHQLLKKTPEAMKQGKQRFERGHNFYDASKNEATELGADFNWELKTVPDAAHNNTEMAPAAADILSEYLKNQGR